jgi:hypothetical protein
MLVGINIQELDKPEARDMQAKADPENDKGQKNG